MAWGRGLEVFCRKGGKDSASNDAGNDCKPRRIAGGSRADKRLRACIAGDKVREVKAGLHLIDSAYGGGWAGLPGPC